MSASGQNATRGVPSGRGLCPTTSSEKCCGKMVTEVSCESSADIDPRDPCLRIYSSSPSESGCLWLILADPHIDMKGSSPCRTNQGKALIDAISWSRLSARRLRSRIALVLKVPTKQILRHEERFIPET